MRDYAHHHAGNVLAIAFCASVSVSLIIRLWLVHRNDPVLKKGIWSLVLCVPFVGWLFYGAFFTPLAENTVKAPLNNDAFTGGF